MHVLIAPGAFPGTLSAPAVARALARGWASRSKDDLILRPMSDGAADLLEVVAQACGGERVTVPVPGPLGALVPASILLVPGDPPTGRRGAAPDTAFVEAGQVLGAHLVSASMRRRATLHGSSEGLGHLVRAAFGTGAGRVVVGIGRAVTHDAGAGLLRGLGMRGTGLRDDHLGDGGSRLGVISRADLAGLADLRAGLADRELVIACAQDVPLLGLHGAGAALTGDARLDPGTAQDLEGAVGYFAAAAEAVVAGALELRPRLAMAARSDVGAPGALPGPAPHAHAGREARRLARRPRTGAGGGVAFALALLGARLDDGAGVVADTIGLGPATARADLVLTGGGVVDAHALHSGVLATGAAAGRAHGVPVVAIASVLEVTRRELAELGVVGAYPVHHEYAPFARRTGAVVPAADDPGALAARAARVAATWSH